MSRIVSLTCVASVCAVMISCTKMNSDLVNEAPGGQVQVVKSDYQASEFLTSSVGVIPREQSTVFKLMPDGNIIAGLIQQESLDSVTYSIIKSANQVAFTRAAVPSDTILVAYLNQSGRISSVKQGNAPDFNFLPTNFQYQNGRLSRVDIKHNDVLMSSEFTYDNNGNIIRIKEISGEEEAPAVTEFKYDLHNKATGQVYHDAPGMFTFNTFALLQYAGYFPEMSPVNLRTKTTVTWNSDYEAYNVRLGNHRVDANGLLTAYDVLDEEDNIVRTHLVAWQAVQQ